MKLTTTIEVELNGHKYATRRWVETPDEILNGLSEEGSIFQTRAAIGAAVQKAEEHFMETLKDRESKKAVFEINGERIEFAGKN